MLHFAMLLLHMLNAFNHKKEEKKLMYGKHMCVGQHFSSESSYHGYSLQFQETLSLGCTQNI